MDSKPSSKISLDRKRLFSIALAFALTLPALPRHCFAQVIDPVTAAQAPIPGAGHQYIGVGSETVNPADGTPSFSLPIQTPSGRQLAFPFGIRYNGAAPFYISGNGESPHFDWTTPILNGTPPPFDINGWSYALPNYVGQAFVQSESEVGPPGQSQFNYCWAGQNYSFTDLAGVERTLYVTNNWADVNNPTPNACTPSTYAGGGDDGVATTFGTATTSIQPPLAVTDKSGTVYQFPSGPGISTNPSVVGGGITPFGVLAQTITDKNGNQIKLTGANNGVTLGAGGYTDTLGRPVVSWSGLGSSAGDQLSVSGLERNIVVKWTTTTVTFPETSTFLSGTSNGSTCGFSGSQSIPISVVSEIDLPNSQKYSFAYGSEWGLLEKITFPDGGYVRYVWGRNPASQITYQQWTPQANDTEDCYALVDMPAITDRYVSYDGSTETLHQAFKYNNTTIVNSGSAPPYWSSKTTTVTNSDLAVPANSTVTKYTYTPVSLVVGPYSTSWQTLVVPVEQTVLYEDGTGNTVETVNQTWFNRFTMVGEQTVLSNGQSETTLRCPDVYDRILATYEYGFQSNGTTTSYPACGEAPQGGTTLGFGLPTPIGPLLRQTVTAYHTFANTHILDEPNSVTVSNGSGSQVKLTNYLYDAGTPTSSGAKTGFVSPPGLRGNATSVSQWLNTTGGYLTHSYAYYDTGQVYTATDPCGNTSCPDSSGTSFTTTYSYADTYAAGTGSPTGQTNAYLTQVTYPSTSVAHKESFTWGFNDGLLRSHTDQNVQTSNYSYVDPLVRLTEVQGPPDPNNGGQRPTTTYTYTDWTPAAPTDSSIATKQLENTAGAQIESNTILNGMGQPLFQQTTSDPSGLDSVDTTYDGMGRAHTVSNPHRPSSPASTDGITTYTYDALNRKLSQVDSDGTSTQTWKYSGNTVTYTDEDGNQWVRANDALGRLITVFEPSAGSKQASVETDYTYNALDNLLSVKQWGGPSGTPGGVARSFTYDSLSRLTQSFNPEAGWICYGTSGGAVPNGSNCTSGYDANGNLASKTDARNIITSYSYDSLNRLLSKRFSNDPGSTPSSCYQYDSSSLGVGRLASEWTRSASAGACAATPPSTGLWSRRSIISYNAMGRILSEQQCTPSNCTNKTPYAPAYSFDLAGNLYTATNGVTSTPTVGTLTFTSPFDAAGRLLSISSNWNDAPAYPSVLFSTESPSALPCPGSLSKPYTAFGGLMNATYGGGLTLNRGYDVRLRTTCEIDTGGSLTNGTSASATVTVTGTEQVK